MSKIKHKNSDAQKVLEKMNECQKSALEVGKRLEELAVAVEENCKGNAAESLISLLTKESERIKKEENNWQTLYEKAQTVGTDIENLDKSLAQSIK